MELALGPKDTHVTHGISRQKGIEVHTYNPGALREDLRCEATVGHAVRTVPSSQDSQQDPVSKEKRLRGGGTGF